MRRKKREATNRPFVTATSKTSGEVAEASPCRIGANQNAETTVNEILTATNQLANDLDVSFPSDVPEVTFDPTSETGLASGSSFSSSVTVDTTEGPEGPLTGTLSTEANETE